MTEDIFEWAEEHGYVSYTCSLCGRQFYTDGDPECPDCGASEEENEDEV